MPRTDPPVANAGFSRRETRKTCGRAALQGASTQISTPGLTRGLLRAAVAYAVAQGAKIVEAYPVDPGARLYTYLGSPATFRAAGFRDVTPPGRERRVFRYERVPT